MGNQYYATREDGETYGPFEDSDSALVWLIDEYADPDGLENGVPLMYQEAAAELYSWYQSLVSHGTTRSSVEYGAWLTAAESFTADVEYLIFGVEFVVDPQARGITHLLDPQQVHNPPILEMPL